MQEIPTHIKVRKIQCQKQAVYNQRDQCSIDHFRYNDPSQIEEQADPRQFLPFSEALDESILSACDSITKIGGYMIVFSVLISFMAKLSFQNFFWKLLLLPGVELTGGIRMFCQLDLTSELRFLLVMAHCSFGGVCALFQTKCMIRSQNWSFPRYIAEKLITAMVTSLFAFCYMKLFG